MKYLGIRIDSKLNWKAYIDDIALKLIRANSMLYKVRDFVNAGILKAIYHAQKQPTRGVPRKRFSENMQQIYRRKPMPKCDFNNVALRSGCFMCYLSHICVVYMGTECIQNQSCLHTSKETIKTDSF